MWNYDSFVYFFLIFQILGIVGIGSGHFVFKKSVGLQDQSGGCTNGCQKPTYSKSTCCFSSVSSKVQSKCCIFLNLQSFLVLPPTELSRNCRTPHYRNSRHTLSWCSIVPSPCSSSAAEAPTPKSHQIWPDAKCPKLISTRFLRNCLKLGSTLLFLTFLIFHFESDIYSHFIIILLLLVFIG